jgi:hypothetical protein
VKTFPFPKTKRGRQNAFPFSNRFYKNNGLNCLPSLAAARAADRMMIKNNETKNNGRYFLLLEDGAFTVRFEFMVLFYHNWVTLERVARLQSLLVIRLLTITSDI